jgi:site-specific DNA recombinase
MRVAAYVRVLTSRQVKLQTIEQQLERVQKHVQEKGWDLPQENIFRDDGYSGTTLKRPALDALRDQGADERARGRSGPFSGSAGAQR